MKIPYALIVKNPKGCINRYKIVVFSSFGITKGKYITDSWHRTKKEAEIIAKRLNKYGQVSVIMPRRK
ncbi:MAG: hypothetical protein DDT33_01558 [Firmicutes bacterium]|nr:hypothetical protein [Bacillota bacterium]